METKIFNGKPSTEDALVNMEKLVNMEEQVKMEKLLMSLKKYDPSNDYKKKTRKEVLKNATFPSDKKPSEIIDMPKIYLK